MKPWQKRPSISQRLWKAHSGAKGKFFILNHCINNNAISLEARPCFITIAIPWHLPGEYTHWKEAIKSVFHSKQKETPGNIINIQI